MPRLPSSWLVFSFVGCLLGMPCSQLVRAIELRTTNGDRTIVRHVSTSSILQQADEVDEAVDPLEYVPAPVMSGKGLPTWEAETCGSTCQMGPSACLPACGERFWVELEFLLWWREGRYFPPLVTTDNPGTLPNATVLFGGDQLSEQARPGGRLQFGMWLDDCQCLGVGGRFVSIAEATTNFELDSSQLPFFARPFFDADPAVNAQEAQVIANAPGQTGDLNLVTESEFMAADAFVRCLMFRNGFARMDFLFGYQFGRLDESLVIETNTMNLLAVRDSFLTRNEFHGGQFGVNGQYRWGCLGVEMAAKFGFGNMNQQAILSGSTTGSTQNSGLLVQQETNAGTHQRDEFSYMHDTGIKLVYYPTERIKLSLGYSMMFFSDVLRPGDQVDTAVDSRLFPAVAAPAGVVRPAFEFDSNHFYAHGLNLGLECRF
ncbi:MAG: BBP7 family outer membrane beta-barrel protein [Pirellulaceae bacterium]|nr:BBP7 family outer membrane beta-barrel protein [Pirellulaceae bacterium]